MNRTVIFLTIFVVQFLLPPGAFASSCTPRPSGQMFGRLAGSTGHLSLSAAKWDAAQGTAKFTLPTVSSKLGNLTLNPEIPVTPATPPTFLLQNEDDHVDNVNDSLAYYVALKNADVPVEMHLYVQGGHAFGLRPTRLPATHWPALVNIWLQTIGMVPAPGTRVTTAKAYQAP